jgi:hypothetical protein
MPKTGCLPAYMQGGYWSFRERHQEPGRRGPRLSGPPPTGSMMGWRLTLSGLPEGYEVVEHEDGLRLHGPGKRVVAEFGPLLNDLDLVRSTAWEDARSAPRERLPVS